MQVQVLLNILSIVFLVLPSAVATCSGNLELPSGYKKGDRVTVNKLEANASGFYYTFDGGATSWVKFNTYTSPSTIHVIARGRNVLLGYYESVGRENRERIAPLWIYRVAGTGTENCVQVLTEYITNPDGWFTVQSKE